jgi:thymidylate synthase
MNSLDKQYQELLKTILEHGVEKKDRTGTGTKSIFGYTIRHNMSEGFPLLTTKKMAWKTMATELLWFLRGDTNIKYLVDNGCHIWDGDAYKNYLNVVMFEKPGYLHEKHGHLNMSVKKEGDNYLPFTQEEFINKIKTDDKFRHWGELGPIYGKQWRDWKGPDGYDWNIKVSETSIDQIANLINDLKTNPDSRRLMVSSWNVGELDQMVLPPCHYGFQVYTRELSNKERIILMNKKLGVTDTLPQYYNTDGEMDKNNIPTRAISLMWNQRSVDTFLGLPFNIASYGLLLMMLADEVNMVPDQLIGNLGDTHIYLNHIEQAEEQIGRELPLEERIELASKDPFFDPGDFGVGEQVTDEHCHEICDSYSIPRKTREPYPLPTVHVRDGIFCSSVNDIILENYQSHPAIKAPLSN